VLVKLCKEHADYERAVYNPLGKSKLLGNALFSAKPSLCCWVIEINKKVVGYISYTIDFSTWEAAKFLYMDCLFIKPEYRSLGIGGEIMKRLNEHAKKKKCCSVQWQTPPFNKRAIKFYDRMGAIGKKKVRYEFQIKKNCED
jgi:ribosomal protein S18 acetylase RimI-like enzyme